MSLIIYEKIFKQNFVNKYQLSFGNKQLTSNISLGKVNLTICLKTNTDLHLFVIFINY